MEVLTLEKSAGIALVTLNRPQALNALNAKTFAELKAMFEALLTDDEVKGVILTGAGPKSFVAGADITELAALDPRGARAASELGQEMFRTIEHFPKPVLAAINGFALGGGCELALACHMRIAASNARLGLPEVNLGLIPGYAGTQRLARVVGKGRALELILTGLPIDAGRALAIGLVNEVVSQEGLLERARELMAKIVVKSAVALRLALEAVNQGMETNPRDGERIEANLFGLAFTSADAREGIAAFLEKRPAEFTDR